MTYQTQKAEASTEGQVEFARTQITEALSDFYAEALAKATTPSFDKFSTAAGVKVALEEKGVGLTGLEIDVVPHSINIDNAALSELYTKHGAKQNGSLVTIKMNEQACFEKFFADPAKEEAY